MVPADLQNPLPALFRQRYATWVCEVWNHIQKLDSLAIGLEALHRLFEGIWAEAVVIGEDVLDVGLFVAENAYCPDIAGGFDQNNVTLV